MRYTAKDSSMAIVDEVFEPEMFKSFWHSFNSMDFAYRFSTSWQKVWKISDGQILSGASLYHSKAPFNSSMDWVHQAMYGLAKQLEDVVGKEGEDWNEISLTPYLYPAGTKISWHDDCGYTGACIFYPHLEWSPHWGGELLVAKTPNQEEWDKLVCGEQKGGLNDNMSREYIAPLLNAYGMGMYVSPLPNRMVFTSGSVWHSINRVDQTAGDKVRCSVVGFFTKDKIS